MSSSRILVVEDDPAIRRGLVDALSFAGHDVRASDDGAEAVGVVTDWLPDLVLLDVMLPGLDGLSVLRRLRDEHPRLPVIMVTARGSEDDRVAGLSGGADDYVVKPFSARELLARVQAVLRRAPERPQEGGQLSLGGRRIDLSRHTVELRDGETRQLADREVALLTHLARTGERPVPRDELLRDVWGLDPRGLNTRTVDMHIARLREKLCDDGQLIVTVRGRGYALGPGVEVGRS
ncbi:MAG: DNA-binding response OmpR family regulator [Pseudohongiellaceae bacterium]|jgi:DNA-binding response OmpR family regulator